VHRVGLFLRAYRDLGHQTPRVERVLAVGRAFLATTGLAAIYLDPTEPARFATLMYALLAGYAVYSIAILAVARRGFLVTRRFAHASHTIDILWASALTFFSEGPVSPFFLFFLFVLLAAAYRWGFRATIVTAGIITAVFLLQTAVAAMGPWNRTWFASTPFDLNLVITRVAYLLLTGFLLGYLADQEKQIRAEMAATAEAMRRPSLELGLGGSVSAIARLFLRMFQASAIDVVIQEHEGSRTLLWHAERTADDDVVPVRRLEMDQASRTAWFFEAPSRTWYCARRRSGGVTDAYATSPAQWTVVPATITMPDLLTDTRDFASLMGVDFGLNAQWRGRVVLFDPADTGSLDTRLNFLQSLADHVTPVLSNVLLSRRLRSRAGAAERARVARELHDGAIQTLIGIEMETEVLRRRAEREAPPLVAEIGHIQGLVRGEVVALRELMQELRPVDLDAPQHLPDFLALQVERFRRDSGICARFVSHANTASLPLKTATEIVRIVQEGLVNVRKHSRARNVLVRLTERASDWILTVEDDGHGFEFAGRLTGSDLAGRLVGPSIIRERARAIGGDVCIESTPGAGARVEVTFNVASER
jgi:signal transduction histidine kinase